MTAKSPLSRPPDIPSLLPHQLMRRAIQRNVADMFGSGGETIDLDGPPGDLGLFGPDTMAWRVHADFTTMMAGGIAALLLQMLHPAALAAIWDHSNFRQDRSGRLRRTAQAGIPAPTRDIPYPDGSGTARTTLFAVRQ